MNYIIITIDKQDNDDWNRAELTMMKYYRDDRTACDQASLMSKMKLSPQVWVGETLELKRIFQNEPSISKCKNKSIN